MNIVIINPTIFPALTDKKVTFAKIYVGNIYARGEDPANRKAIDIKITATGATVAGVSQPVLTDAEGFPVYLEQRCSILTDGAHSVQLLNSNRDELVFDENAVLVNEGQSIFPIIGNITVPADFPTLDEVVQNYTYKVLAEVTDDDVLKTNTGQSFHAGDLISWTETGPSSPGYIDITGNEVFSPTLEIYNSSYLTIPALDIDFGHNGTHAKTMTGNATFTISNPVFFKEIFFVLSGDFVPTFPAEMAGIFGDYEGTATANYYFIKCVSTVAKGGSLKYVARVYQEGSVNKYLKAPI